MEKKLFLLGLGAQKCGTSWIHKYVASSDKSRMGPIKEYHVWDAKFSPPFEDFKVGPTDLIRRRPGAGLRYSRKVQWLRLAMQRVPGQYERHFQGLVSDGGSITGDITPSYSALREPQLATIRARLERAGFEVRVIFMMRDPVERCWSSVRMARRNDRMDKAAVEAAGIAEEAQLRMQYATERAELRTNYHQTIQAIDAVFDPEKVYFGLFENMFTPHEIVRFSDFVGLPANPTLATSKVNASPKSDRLNPDLKEQILSHYRPVFDFCNDRFPETRALWSHSDVR